MQGRFRRFAGKGASSILFTAFEIDLFRILRWCQYAERRDILACCTEECFTNLVRLRLLREQPDTGIVSLTIRGHELLKSIFGEIMPDKYQTYKSNAIKRKLWLSKTMLLFYRTGFDIFPLRMEDVEATPSFLLTATMRGRGRNIWANTRIAGVAAMADTLCCVHCLYPDVGKLLFADELGAFTRNTTPLKAQRQAFVFIGNSYGEMIGELEKPSDSNAARLITYGEAYRRLQLEACIVSCDAVGVTQLRLLSQPNYRTRLTRSILRSHYAPAPEGADYDAVFQGAPFLLALDMDLRRVDALCRNQREQNAMQPAIAALEEQATSVLNARYRDTGLARVFTLTEKTLRTFLPPLPDKAAQPFLTPKGDVIHAPLIRT